MGTNGQSGTLEASSRLVARVIPDVPSFSVDSGFLYAIPSHLSVAIGSVVRVPLGPRRVRGWVIDVAPGSHDGLKEVQQVSGSQPIFAARVLASLRWAAQHYVTPLSTVMAKPGPPNLPRPIKPRVHKEFEVQPGVLTELAHNVAGGARGPLSAHVSGSFELGVDAVLQAGQSVMVVAPTAREVADCAAANAHLGKRMVLADPSMSDRELTTAWTRSTQETGIVVVGTERIAWWPIANLAIAVMLDDGRRGMKARQTPTVHVREVLRSRSKVERFSLTSISRVPTVEMVSAGALVVNNQSRAWGLIEVVDRTEEPPGGGVVTDRVRAALRGVVNRGEQALVFTHRRGFAPAFRCVRCRTLRLCGECGSRATNESVCPRCATNLGPCLSCAARRFEPLGAAVGRVISELGKAVGRENVGSVEDGLPVMVGTERDLVAVSEVDLAVAVDADGLIFGTNYRSTEDALRLLSRVAGTVRDGRGKRTMVQTSQPGHPVLETLRRGDPVGFLRQTLKERREQGFPPDGELIVLEVGHAPSWTSERVAQAVVAPAMALGPVEAFGRLRWLVQGPDLAKTRQALQSVVQELRDAHAQVRVDVDPLDL